MSLLDLVEEDYRARICAQGIDQLAPFAVADVPLGGTDQLADTVGFLVLRHVQPQKLVAFVLFI